MANWYGTCRSNYFKVKDEAAFLAMTELFELTIIRQADKIGFISNSEYGDVPRYWDDADELVSIIDKIAEHLAENQVCVIMEIGAEKARYVTGWALAIAWTGETTEISLGDIYAKAQDEFGGDAQITEATY